MSNFYKNLSQSRDVYLFQIKHTYLLRMHLSKIQLKSKIIRFLLFI